MRPLTSYNYRAILVNSFVRLYWAAWHSWRGLRIALFHAVHATLFVILAVWMLLEALSTWLLPKDRRDKAELFVDCLENTHKAVLAVERGSQDGQA